MMKSEIEKSLISNEAKQFYGPFGLFFLIFTSKISSKTFPNPKCAFFHGSSGFSVGNRPWFDKLSYLRIGGASRLVGPTLLCRDLPPAQCLPHSAGLTWYDDLALSMCCSSMRWLRCLFVRLFGCLLRLLV